MTSASSKSDNIYEGREPTQHEIARVSTQRKIGLYREIVSKFYESKNAERRGAVKPEPLNFETLKKFFLFKFEELEKDLYFREATGFKCVEQKAIRGAWGSDPESFFFMKLRIHDLWPIQQHIEYYDESKLFSVIEFLYDYASEPKRKWYHKWNGCGWHGEDYDEASGKARYREEMNSILKNYESGYELSATGEILKITPTGLESISEEVVITGDSKNIDDRIHGAITKYRRYNATLDDKKDAVRTLADILEYLKKEGVTLPAKDDSDLFNIINNFDMRHHNREQQGGYDKDAWYDWMFYTFLSSINVLLKLRKPK
jgi:hypothetical protein